MTVILRENSIIISVIVFLVYTQSVVMLSTILQCYYDVCRYAERWYRKCRFADSHGAKRIDAKKLGVSRTHQNGRAYYVLTRFLCHKTFLSVIFECL